MLGLLANGINRVHIHLHILRSIDNWLGNYGHSKKNQICPQ